ncbi:TolC family protein [Helicobacter saguini]|uniref:TolC family protein n=2 Tax=Helicobacter saguini TaxID=1548018 RepID=A0A347VTS5_9HELI|nr:TolC family protein [Helicobacter saguini]MWV67601.1 TolC family protein [Helicobacter saguini]MWV69952.1 TolC family protein [Helicobacter saguini]MWV72834.1 TolC family protein [Helicobacter saguini]TLD92398.1 TolC family protein [Helicobacter saguini]
MESSLQNSQDKILQKADSINKASLDSKDSINLTQITESKTTKDSNLANLQEISSKDSKNTNNIESKNATEDSIKVIESKTKDSKETSANATKDKLDSKDFKNTESKTKDSKTTKDKIKNKNTYTDTFFSIFDDPILVDLTNKALKSNTNLLTLESAIRQARATAKINTAAMFPRVTAGANYNYSDNNYRSIQTNTINQNSANASLTFSWELDILGKLNALRMASDQNTLSALQNLSQAQVVLIGDVASFYFTIRQLSEAIALNREITANLQEIYELTQSRYDLGLIGLDSLATTKSNYLNQKNTTLNLESTLEQNINALLVLLNAHELGFSLDSSYEFNAPSLPSITALPADIIFNRPDVRSSVYSLNASIYQRYNKKMALFPSLSLSSNLGQILMSPTRAVGDLAWQIAGNLSMPLINRYSITQDYIISKEATKQAFYTLQNTINTALGEIENAMKNMEVTALSRDNTAQSYDVNKSTYEIMESQYNQKLIDDISKLEYANTYLRARVSLLSAHLSENQAAIALYKAFGGDFNPSVFADSNLQTTAVPKEVDSEMEDIADGV